MWLNLNFGGEKLELMDGDVWLCGGRGGGGIFILLFRWNDLVWDFGIGIGVSMVNGVVTVELLFSAEIAETESLWLCGEYLMQTFVLSKRSVLPLFVESALHAPRLLFFFFFLSRSFTYCCSFTLEIMFVFRVFWVFGIGWFWGFGVMWFLVKKVALLFWSVMVRDGWGSRNLIVYLFVIFCFTSFLNCSGWGLLLQVFCNVQKLKENHHA